MIAKRVRFADSHRRGATIAAPFLITRSASFSDTISRISDTACEIDVNVVRTGSGATSREYAEFDRMSPDSTGFSGGRPNTHIGRASSCSGGAVKRNTGPKL